MSADEDLRIEAEAAREWWIALMGNAVGLIEDAALLASSNRAARGQSLVVLALEELGKASRIFEAGVSRGAEVELPSDFEKWSHRHPLKIATALVTNDHLDHFWSPKGLFPDAWKEHVYAPKALNEIKQAGFYVDRDPDGSISVPSRTAPDRDNLIDQIVRVAGVAEMLLIADHSAMKGQNRVYESTHDLQGRLLPFSHPEDYFATVDALARTEDVPGGGGAPD